MKFEVDHDTLADAVAWVARALPSRPVVPILSGLRLDAEEDGLTLSCFDYELSATAHLPADVAEPGTALVPGRLLAEITRSLPGQPAEFRSDGDEVTLTCGSAEFALVSLPTAEYPALPPVPPLGGLPPCPCCCLPPMKWPMTRYPTTRAAAPMTMMPVVRGMPRIFFPP